MPEGLDFDLGFAIDDPMGLDALLLARALIRLGKAIKPELRMVVARAFDETAQLLENDAHVDSGVSVLRQLARTNEDDRSN